MQNNTQLVINYRTKYGTLIRGVLSPNTSIQRLENALYAIKRNGGEFLGIKRVS